MVTFAWLAGAVVGFGLLVIIPVVAILTEHQRKMARILHGQAGPSEDVDPSVIIGVHAGGRRKEEASDKAVLDEIRALRNEVAELRMQVASLQSDHGAEKEVRARLNP